MYDDDNDDYGSGSGSGEGDDRYNKYNDDEDDAAYNDEDTFDLNFYMEAAATGGAQSSPRSPRSGPAPVPFISSPHGVAERRDDEDDALCCDNTEQQRSPPALLL